MIGFSLFPSSEKPQFLIEINTPSQSNLDYTNYITKQIESQLKKYPEIKYFSSNVGKGNPQIYYNVLQRHEQTNFSQIFVQLNEGTSRSEKMNLIESLRKKWTPYTGAKIEVKNFEQGPPVVAPVEVRLYGDNLDSLRALSLKIEDLIKNTDGTIYINNPLKNLKSDLEVNINKDKAGLLGVATADIDKDVRLAVSGLDVGKMTDEEGDNYDILVTKEKSDLQSLDAFKNLYVNNNKGTAIPLNQISTLKFVTTPPVINHRDKIRTVSVSAFVKEGFLNDKISSYNFNIVNGNRRYAADSSFRQPFDLSFGSSYNRRINKLNIIIETGYTGSLQTASTEDLAVQNISLYYDTIVLPNDGWLKGR